MTDNKKDNKLEEQLEKKFSRRNFIQGTGLTVGGLIVGGGIGTLLGSKSDNTTEKVETTTDHSQHSEHAEPKEMPNEAGGRFSCFSFML